jgi:TM2 domain-containing membrane protein YozV
MRTKTNALLLCFFLGGIGGHKFYLGQTGVGIFYLMFCWTFIPAMVAMLECVMLILMSEDEFNRRYNFTSMMQGATQQNQVAQSVVVNMAPPVHAVPQAAAPSDIGASLAQLNDLRIAGALTDDEFTMEKAKLLGARQATPQLTA